MTCQTKVCNKCGEEKEISLFHKHKYMKDGHLNACKSCTSEYSKNRRKTHPEIYKEYEQSRCKLPHRIELAKTIRDAYRKEYPTRYKAVCAVNNAVRGGKISKLPCFICGSEKSVAHHVSYDLPLDVSWLCQKHHKELHADM